MTDLTVSFSHVHLYVDHVDELHVYQKLEYSLNNNNNEQVKGSTTTSSFVSHNRDIIRQLIAGLGFRVTGCRWFATTNTRSMLLSSSDPCGVQIVVSAADPQSNVPVDEYHHFDAANIRRFMEAHNGRQGIAVLGFTVNNVGELYARYQLYHPTLILDRSEYTTWDDEGGIIKILEVFAYYLGDTPESGVDVGTVLRFVEKRSTTSDPETSFARLPLPGFVVVPGQFDKGCQAAYCDHWVSNVHSRIGFLKTLEDVLGFTPKVDFNAGVVAAGEAQIESTVTGNSSDVTTDDPSEALRDQSQVYLPINNALSDVGHVHGFLQELGQGVQHIASRVENLVDFVQRANDNRVRTGEGFTFLRIPRSYYGILTKQDIMDADKSVSVELAQGIMQACESQHITTDDGAVDLDLTGESIGERLASGLEGTDLLEAYGKCKPSIISAILNSRYKNLKTLLHGRITDEIYLGIVRNQILVDVQGDDLLYQIFTSNILQRAPGEEAPFLEFIQRVCSDGRNGTNGQTKIKPGCGGFGIRNFLTLFLSIEVSKAMSEVSEAKLNGDEQLRLFAQQKVDCFTCQLNESNPILTGISDAMTEAGECKEQWEQSSRIGDETTAAKWKERMEGAARRKEDFNRQLLSVSLKYMNMMKSLREDYTARSLS